MEDGSFFFFLIDQKEDLSCYFKISLIQDISTTYIFVGSFLLQFFFKGTTFLYRWRLWWESGKLFYGSDLLLVPFVYFLVIQILQKFGPHLLLVWCKFIWWAISLLWVNSYGPVRSKPKFIKSEWKRIINTP